MAKLFYLCIGIMSSEEHNNPLNHSAKKGFRHWSELSLPGRVWRVLWVTLLTLWGFTVVQVILGCFFNPPLTPLMVQRFFEQAGDKGRSVRFERDYVSLDAISPNLITAVVNSEDGLFMYHHGFDVKQMKKAWLGNRSGKRVRGGSTISQQTAKNAFLPHSRTMFRKAVEAYYTVLIEALWGKHRIMEVYLNIIEFGDGIYGAEAASQHYFGHSADRLTRREASQLAATLPSPVKRNPANPTPYFLKQSDIIAQRFSWGDVDIDMPRAKRRERAGEDQSLVEFFFWMLKQK